MNSALFVCFFFFGLLSIDFVVETRDLFRYLRGEPMTYNYGSRVRRLTSWSFFDVVVLGCGIGTRGANEPEWNW